MDDFDCDWDFSTSDASYRRNGIGCAGIVFLGFFALVFAFIALFWLVQHRRQIELVVLVGLVATAAYFGRGYVAPLFAFATKDTNAPPTTLAEVKPGFVHTTGLVGGVAAPIVHEPLHGTPCVFFRVVVEALHARGKILFESRSADELVLDDGSGNRIVVRLDGAKWLVQRRHDLVSSAAAPDEHVARYFGERGLAFADDVRVCVTWIAAHELVFVRGVARETSARGETGYRTTEARSPLELVATATHPVLVALEAIPAKRERAAQS